MVSFLVFMFVTVELVNSTALNHVVWSAAADDGRQRRREVSGVTSACFLLSFTTTL